MARGMGLLAVLTLVWILGGCATGPGGQGIGPGPMEAGAGADPESGRLKYKGQGPPCMCQSGLSETDIQAAQGQPGD